MIFTRRKFAQTAASALVYTIKEPAKGAGLVACPKDFVTLTALYAAHLPARLEVPVRVLSPSSRIYERRVYAEPVPLHAFARYGIRPTLVEGTSYVFPFVSLQARQKAWDRLNADLEWGKISAQAKLREISLYQAENGR